MHVPDPRNVEATDPAPIMRALTIQADVAQVMTAWCDPEVQRQLFAGAAELVEVGSEASLWRLTAPLGRHPVVRLRTHAPSTMLVQQVLETDDGAQAAISLAVRPCAHRPGVEVELRVRYAPDGLVEGLLTRLLDPPPAALAGQILRRLRALLESGEIPSLTSNPAAR